MREWRIREDKRKKGAVCFDDLEGFNDELKETVNFLVERQPGRRRKRMGFDYGGFGMGFGAFEVIFTIVFVIVIGMFVVTAVKGIGTWNKNNHSPRLSVAAAIVSKRTEVTHHSHANAGDATGAHGYSNSSSAWYYVTFQVESGDRMEFSVTGSEYGMLAEGDTGKLSFQGTRYLSFERNI